MPIMPPMVAHLGLSPPKPPRGEGTVSDTHNKLPYAIGITTTTEKC